MYQAIRLPSDSGDCHVLTRKDQLRPELAARYVDRNIGRWLSDPLLRRQIIDLTGGTPLTVGAPGSGRSTGEWERAFRAHLGEAFRRGDLVLYRSTPNGGGPRENGADCAPRPPDLQRPAPAPRQDRKTWVEIRLVDEQGFAVANERCRIELPDGAFVEGRTDESGILRVESVEEGTCEVTFPEIDLREWEPAGTSRAG